MERDLTNGSRATRLGLALAVLVFASVVGISPDGGFAADAPVLQAAAEPPIPPAPALPARSPEDSVERVPGPDDIDASLDPDLIRLNVESVVGDRLGMMWLNEQRGLAGRAYVGVKNLSADEKTRIEQLVPPSSRVEVVNAKYSMSELELVLEEGRKLTPEADVYGMAIELEGRGPDAKPLIVIETPRPAHLDAATALRSTVPNDLLRIRLTNEKYQLW